MRVFHFSEQAYIDALEADNQYLRVTLPNRDCDPRIAADLYHRYYDEWQLADELGLDIMVNEHHSTATCLSASANLSLGILSRITRKARLLALGVPLANRADPLRVAEELSIIDVISRGRLEMGFVKGVATELPISNAQPVRMMERLWEGHDLIIKAMTTHDGPFSWEGQYYHYRNVNIWPRPWQQPHPPIWITATSLGSIAAVAERGHVMASFLSGLKTREMFDHYRTIRQKLGLSAPGPDRFAYLALVAVAHNRDEALRRANHIACYLRTTNKVAPQYVAVPGYLSVADAAKMMRQGPRMRVSNSKGDFIDMRTASMEELVDARIIFAGTPDEVYHQIAGFSDHVGGLGNLLAMAQGGTLPHAEAVDNLTLLAREVLPRLRESHPATAA